MNNNLKELGSIYKNKGSSPYLRKNIKNIIDKNDENNESKKENLKKMLNNLEFLKNTNEEIKNHSRISKEIGNELKNKRRMIASSERMLQVKQDKNIYKEKLMYSYIALVIAIIIFLLVSYYYFK